MDPHLLLLLGVAEALLDVEVHLVDALVQGRHSRGLLHHRRFDALRHVGQVGDGSGGHGSATKWGS